MYSFLNLDQKTSAKYCACFQRRRPTKSLEVKFPACRTVSGFSSKRWLGVRAVGSLGSSLRGVNGLLFRIASTSQKRVDNESSFSFRGCSPSKLDRIFRVVLISLSHTPPKWEAPGGLKFHSTSRSCNQRSICALFHSFIVFLSSFLVPTKLVPLSLVMLRTLPRLDRNILRVLMKLSVDRSKPSSR